MLLHDRAVTIVVATALGLRLVWLFYAQPTPVSDFNDYRTLASDLLGHGQFGYPEPTAFFLPLHPLVLAGLMVISDHDLWLGFGMVLLSTLACFLVIRVALRIWGNRRISLIAGWLMAVFPVFVLYSPVLATEHLFVVLTLCAMLLVLRLTEGPSPRIALASGIVLGLAGLTRGEGLFYVPAFLVFLWWGARLAGTRARLAHSGLLVAGVILVLTPWWVRNSLVVAPDAGLSSSAGVNFYFAHNDSGFYGPYEGGPLDELDAAEASRLGWRLGFEYLAENPLRLVQDIHTGTARLFGAPDYAVFWSTREAAFRGDPTLGSKPLRLAGALGQLSNVAAAFLTAVAAASVFGWRRWPRQALTLLLPLILSPWLLRTVLYWAKPRFRFLFDVLSLLFAAFAIQLLSGRTEPEPA